MTGMRRGALFVLTLMLVAPLGAAPRKPAPKPAPNPAAEEKLIQSCDAHKFEAVVDTMVDGQAHKSKVKLCGVEGQSDAEWIGTLKDAIRKLDANKEMAPATRDQIVAAIKAEIGRLSIVGVPVAPKRDAKETAAPSLSRDYAALPPLPPTPEAPVAAAPALPVAATNIASSTTAAPLPSAGPSPVQVPPLAVTVPLLKISCEEPTDFAGPASCVEFVRETRLTIEADADVPAGTVLEFVRNGRPQGNLSLDGVGRGRPLHSGLPPSVCAGFGAGRLELRIVQVRGAQAMRSEGTYTLRC
jgi:hypothetical protein